jgi:hypothetical protein
MRRVVVVVSMVVAGLRALMAFMEEREEGKAGCLA